MNMRSLTLSPRVRAWLDDVIRPLRSTDVDFTFHDLTTAFVAFQHIPPFLHTSIRSVPFIIAFNTSDSLLSAISIKVVQQDVAFVVYEHHRPLGHPDAR